MRVSQRLIDEQCDRCRWRKEIETQFGEIPHLNLIRNELEGIQRISIGVQTIFEQLRCRNQSVSECIWKTTFGTLLVGTGLYQLVGPILIGAVAYKLYKNA